MVSFLFVIMIVIYIKTLTIFDMPTTVLAIITLLDSHLSFELLVLFVSVAIPSAASVLLATLTALLLLLLVPVSVLALSSCVNPPFSSPLAHFTTNL